MAFIEVEGDLFAGNYPAIGHGVNTHGMMSGGIARDFATRWPMMETKYRYVCSDISPVPGDVWKFKPDDGPTIFNIFSQDKPGKDATYAATVIGVDAAMVMAQNLGIYSLAIPAVGCGIGGLDWETLKPLLKEVAGLHPQMDLMVVRPKPRGVWDVPAHLLKNGVEDATVVVEGDLDPATEEREEQGSSKTLEGAEAS